MTPLSNEQRLRLISRLRTIAERHVHQPDVAADFLRLADDVAAGIDPGSK